MAEPRDCHWPEYPHPNCNACGATISRRADHAHVYHRRASYGESVCGNCWVCIAVAAEPVLDAARELDIDPTGPAIYQALKKGCIAILAQSMIPSP